MYQAFRLWLLESQRDHIAAKRRELDAQVIAARNHALEVDAAIMVREAKMLAAQSPRRILRQARAR